MFFRLKFHIAGSVRPATTRQDVLETEFWQDYARRAGTFALAINPADHERMHERIFKDLPGRLLSALSARMSRDERVREAVPRVTAGGVDVSAPAATTQFLSENLSVQVTRVSGGSLEVIIVIWGLSLLTGIDVSVLVGYLKEVSPGALASIFGGSPLLFDVEVARIDEPVGDVAAPPPAQGAGATAGRLRELLQHQATPYLLPAVLAGLLIWLGASSYSTVSTRLLDERKDLSENLIKARTDLEKQRSDLATRMLETVNEREKSLSMERTAVAAQVVELTKAFIDAAGKKDQALESAIRAVNGEQFALMKEMIGTAKVRDAAMFEAVRAFLAPEKQKEGAKTAAQ